MLLTIINSSIQRTQVNDKKKMFVLETNHFCSLLPWCKFTKRVRALYAWPIMRKLKPTFNFSKVI